MPSYLNTARHAITLPNGRPIGAGETFEHDGDLTDFNMAGSLLVLDEPAPPPAPDQNNPVRGVQSSEAFGAGSVTQGPPTEDQQAPVEDEAPKTTRKGGRKS